MFKKEIIINFDHCFCLCLRFEDIKMDIQMGNSNLISPEFMCAGTKYYEYATLGISPREIV